jgi:hypothetical protein
MRRHPAARGVPPLMPASGHRRHHNAARKRVLTRGRGAGSDTAPGEDTKGDGGVEANLPGAEPSTARHQPARLGRPARIRDLFDLPAAPALARRRSSSGLAGPVANGESRHCVSFPHIEGSPAGGGRLGGVGPPAAALVSAPAAGLVPDRRCTAGGGGVPRCPRCPPPWELGGPPGPPDRSRRPPPIASRYHDRRRDAIRTPGDFQQQAGNRSSLAPRKDPGGGGSAVPALPRPPENQAQLDLTEDAEMALIATHRTDLTPVVEEMASSPAPAPGGCRSAAACGCAQQRIDLAARQPVESSDRPQAAATTLRQSV